MINNKNKRNGSQNSLFTTHSHTGTNMLVNIPVNNTEYICVSQTINGDIISDPAYIIIAGGYSRHIF